MAVLDVNLKSDSQIDVTMDGIDNLTANFANAMIVEIGDYNNLANKPSIEGNILQGDKSFKQLGLDVLAVWEIEKILYLG